MRPHAALLAGALLIAANAFAQGAPPLPPAAQPPTNVILPNYGGVPAGEIGSLEVGAFLARADDTSATFYNPAGLTRTARGSLSGTAGMYQWGTVQPSDLHATAVSFQQVPAMFGATVKDPIGLTGVSAGVSFVRITAWQQGVDFVGVRQLAAATDRTSYSSASSLSASLASAGVAYMPGEKWRVGGGVDVQLTATDRRQSLANQYRTSSSLQSLNVTSRSEATAAHLRMTVGTQVDVLPSLTLGTVFRTSGLGLRSGGMLMLEGASSAGGTVTASHYDEDLDVTHKIPFELKTGVAWTHRRAALEADVLLYGGAGAYRAYATRQPILVMTASDGGVPSSTSYAATAPMVDSQRVTNVLVGGHVAVTPSGTWTIHGGVGTDRSPVGPTDQVFTHVDLRKVTLGVSARTKRVLGSCGVLLVSGDSADIPLRNLPAGTITTTYHVRNVGLVYSIAVQF